MAQGKDLLTRLADAGEDALKRLGDQPGMDRMVNFANSTRDRLDELTKRVRGVDALEKRVTKLEQQVAALSGTGGSGTQRKATGTAKRASSSAKSSSAKTGPASPG